MTPISLHLNSQILTIRSHTFTHEGRKTDLISELDHIPRSGKFYRFRNAGIDLPCRSIYDHMLSLAYNADVLVDILGLDINRTKLANMFVFHDLAEVFVGDVPYFTSEEIVGVPIKTPEQKEQEEHKANKFILSIFTGKLREDFVWYIAEFENTEMTEFMRIFRFFDRTDSILNVWRYIDRFRNSIDIEQFLTVLKDYFTNPHTHLFSLDNDTSNFILFIKNPDRARDFYIR